MTHNENMDKMRMWLKQMYSFEGNLFVYSLSYSLLLTIAPTIIIFVTVLRFFNIEVMTIIDFILMFVPKEFIIPFVDFLLLKSQVSIWASFVTVAISLFLSSRCIYSFLLIACQNEKIEYPKWSLRIYSIYEFVLIVTYILACILVNTFMRQFYFFGSFLYFVASIVGFYIFYHLCTFIAREKTYGLLGALYSTLSIYLVGLLFFKILDYFTNYDNIYGPLASFMILTLSVFVVSTIIYSGYLLNNIFEIEENVRYRKNTFFHLCDKIEKTILERN